MLDCERLRRLRDVPEPFSPEFYTWDELIAAAREAPPSSVIVVDPFPTGARTEVAPELPALLAAAAMTPVVAAVAMRAATEAQLRALLELGVSDVLDERTEGGPDAARALLESVKAKPLKLLLERSLSRFVSFDALTLVRAAAEVTVDGGGAEDLSDVFESQERTVSGWCAREALPPPRRLLAWLRLILALALLADTGRRIGQAASAAGYTDHSLRRALRTFLGAGKATREWSVTDAVEAFDAELAALRERNRQKGRKSGAAR
jgi:AraC-like DNA-binding protein